LLVSFALLAGGCGGSSSSDGDASSGSDSETENVVVSDLVVTGPSFTFEDGVVFISGGGTYTLTGALSGGMVHVSAAGSDVTLILDNATITNASGPAILFEAARSATVMLASGSENAVTDGGSNEDYDAAIFSLVPLTVGGEGKLDASGNNQEGIASDSTLTIDGGVIRVVAVDDGLNSGGDLTINDGYLYVEAVGDGIDSNANLTINGGTIISLGGMSGGDGGLDADDGYSLAINGGTVIATGQDIPTPDAASKQRSMIVNFNEQSAGTLVHIEGGAENMTFRPDKSYRAFFYSSGSLANGVAYGVHLGGSCDGIEADGLYISGTYAGGTQQSHTNGSTEFTITGTTGVFNVGTGGNPPGGDNNQPAPPEKPGA
ncbi:carbohydrate-binding domain-containing protein, partial [Synergistaceae bacterium OttesenSCG-928-I11]|nr:carbohydrate-binding domain-containing protein [Synergistaceae bacterium OttesenSCG-928-I11]